MADTKISALTDGLTATATDRLPAARSPFGATDNRYVTPAYIKDYILGLVNSWTAAQQFTTLEIGHATDTTLARLSAGDLSVEGNALYRAGGTDVALADGGTGASLTDPNADRLLFWDDSAGAMAFLTAGSGLTITDTTITAAGGGGSDINGMKKIASTIYICPAGVSQGSQSTGANKLWVAPVFVGKGGTATKIGIRVNVAGTGAVRLGIYNNANARPSTLVLDAGTVDPGTTGVKEITISQSVSDNSWYWLALVSDVTFSFNSWADNAAFVIGQHADNATYGALNRSFTYAALPADESASTYTMDTANMPNIWLRG
jgi:hypothetical protein